LGNKFFCGINVHVIVDGLVRKESIGERNVQRSEITTFFVLKVIEIVEWYPFIVRLTFHHIALGGPILSFGGDFDTMMGSIPDVIDLSFVDGVRVFASRISVEDNADSGDI
jgi:hypothetical protein